MAKPIAIAVHGGAGVMRSMTSVQKMYCKALESALVAVDPTVELGREPREGEVVAYESYAAVLALMSR